MTLLSDFFSRYWFNIFYFLFLPMHCQNCCFWICSEYPMDHPFKEVLFIMQICPVSKFNDCFGNWRFLIQFKFFTCLRVCESPVWISPCQRCDRVQFHKEIHKGQITVTIRIKMQVWMTELASSEKNLGLTLTVLTLSFTYLKKV